MTKIKLCGLRRTCDIEYVNRLLPDYIGFVFAPGTKRFVEQDTAENLRNQLDQRIIPVGVFVDEEPERIAELLHKHIIQVVQLHGNEDESYMKKLRSMADCTIIKAFRMKGEEDLAAIEACPADFVLLDSGGGTGTVFDWSVLRSVKRPYFLAGGLTPENVETAIAEYHPYGVDASSSLETDGWKDNRKMTAFVEAVRQRKDG